MRVRGTLVSLNNQLWAWETRKRDRLHSRKTTGCLSQPRWALQEGSALDKNIPSETVMVTPPPL